MPGRGPCTSCCPSTDPAQLAAQGRDRRRARRARAAQGEARAQGRRAVRAGPPRASMSPSDRYDRAQLARARVAGLAYLTRRSSRPHATIVDISARRTRAGGERAGFQRDCVELVLRGRRGSCPGAVWLVFSNKQYAILRALRPRTTRNSHKARTLVAIAITPGGVPGPLLPVLVLEACSPCRARARARAPELTAHATCIARSLGRPPLAAARARTKMCGSRSSRR